MNTMSLKINLMNEKINVNPERKTEVSQEEFLSYFFRLNGVVNPQSDLSKSEIALLVKLGLHKDPLETGISKTNLYKVYDSLTSKGYLKDKTLQEPAQKLIDYLITNLESGVDITFNFKIKQDDTG